MEIDAVAIFESYADSKGWRFAYGPKEILNYETTLKDLTGGEYLMLMFPFDERAKMTDHGTVGYWEIGTMIYLGRKFDNTSTTGTKSKLDETMKQKYDRRLLTLREDLTTMIKDIFCTGDYELKSARVSREINKMNENLDFVVADIVFSNE